MAFQKIEIHKELNHLRREQLKIGKLESLGVMAGGIAQAYYKEVPKQLIDRVWLILDSSLKDVIREFEERYESPH